MYDDDCVNNGVLQLPLPPVDTSGLGVIVQPLALTLLANHSSVDDSPLLTLSGVAVKLWIYRISLCNITGCDTNCDGVGARATN